VYTAHMRKVHDESHFPFMVLGCNRIGGKGVFRKKDFLKHMASIHQKVAMRSDLFVDCSEIKKYDHDLDPVKSLSNAIVSYS